MVASTTHLLVILRITAGLGDFGESNIEAFALLHPGVSGEVNGDLETKPYSKIQCSTQSLTRQERLYIPMIQALKNVKWEAA